MKLMLKSFSQEVVIDEKDEVKYFAVFVDDDSGRELRLPIPKGTSEAIIRFLWAGPGEPPKMAEDNVEPPEPETPPEATEFGGDEVPEEDPAQDVEEYEDDGPGSEEEVPSL
jgi:hypothetical protein